MHGSPRAWRAAGAENQTAAAVLACWQWCTTEDPALEPALRAGAELFPATRADLGHLLLRTDRVEEARQVWTHGAELGEVEVESLLPLGNLHADVLGNEPATEACYLQGIEHGDAHCHHNLAVLLEEGGDLEGAEAHYRMAIEGGDLLAIRSLRELLDD